MTDNTLLDVPLDTPTVGKVYKRTVIRIATFLGGTLVATYLMAENFKTFGEPDKARKTWIYGIIATILLFIILAIPQLEKLPSPVLPLIYTAMTSYWVLQFQEKKINAHIQAGGEVFNWKRVALVTFIGLILMLGVIQKIIPPFEMTV